MSDDILQTDIYNKILEAIYLQYGYDFRDYSESFLIRRIQHFQKKMSFESPEKLFNKIIIDPTLGHMLIHELTIPVTKLFRDPEFFKALRTQVVNFLRTFPRLKIWIAGCSTGEEAMSLAILLHEEGLLDQTILYATDLNPNSLNKAREGIIRLKTLKESTTDYLLSGGKETLSSYFTVESQYALFDQKLLSKIVFAEHNLASDGSFGEMQMILCRNVMIYFNHKLQARVYNLFLNSLTQDGHLCLGSKESLMTANARDSFIHIDHENRIFKRSESLLGLSSYSLGHDIVRR